jgi:formate-dependent nitrite reductase membrane component NrfD
MNPFVADPDWGIWIILYFYLGGIAAGAYFLATLVALFGSAEDLAISRAGYRLALPLISICGIFLIVDLERPERFWHMMFQSEVVHRAIDAGWPVGGWGTMVYAINLKWWSPMSLGAWALALFGLCSTLSVLGTLWPGGRLERLLMHGAVGRALQIVGSAVGFFVGSYTGVLLTASNQPLWSLSDWIGPLFLTSAASTGIAAVLLLAHRGGTASAAIMERLEWAALWALGLELFVFLIFLASLGGVLPLTLHTVAGWLLVLGTLGVGLLLPLVLHMGVGSHEPRRIVSGAACVLVGGLALRAGIVKTAPALLESWPDPYRGTPPGPLWQSVAGIGLLVVTVAIAVAIPWILRRQWHLSVPQTGLAGLASVLACVAVAGYVVRPQTDYPLLERLTWPGLFPEQERPRGGGPGASALNQPDDVELRSKINGTLPHEP